MRPTLIAASLALALGGTLAGVELTAGAAPHLEAVGQTPTMLVPAADMPPSPTTTTTVAPTTTTTTTTRPPVAPTATPVTTTTLAPMTSGPVASECVLTYTLAAGTPNPDQPASVSAPSTATFNGPCSEMPAVEASLPAGSTVVSVTQSYGPNDAATCQAATPPVNPC